MASGASVTRASNHRHPFVVGALAALAGVHACHRDVTADLAFACRTDSDCAAGWTCDGVCRPRAQPDAASDILAPNDTLDAVSESTLTSDTPPETVATTCPGAAFSWTRAKVPGFTVPATAADFVANGLDDVWAVTGGRVHRYDPDGRATAIGPDLGATAGITFAPMGGVFVVATETRSVDWVTASGQRTAAVVGLARPTGVALTHHDSIAIADWSGAIFEAPIAAPAAADPPDPAVATPVTGGLYTPTLVADSPDGLRRFSASGYAGVVWVQTWTGSGWSAPVTFASLPDIIAPPELATCTTPAAPCFTATGMSGVCASDAGRPWCRADATAPDPRVSSPGVGMFGAIICLIGAEGMPCDVAYAGVGLSGSCTDRHCALATRDVEEGCALEELGEPCALIVSARMPAPTVPGDGDSDGISDARELACGTDPADSDSDDDTIEDGAEPGWCLDDDGDGKVNARDQDANDDMLADGPANASPVPWVGVCVARERLENWPDMPTAVPCVPPVATLVGRGFIMGLAVSDCGDVYFTELPQGTGAAVLWRASADGKDLAQVLSSTRDDPALGPIHWVVVEGNPPRGVLIGVDTKAGGLVAVDITSAPSSPGASAARSSRAR